MDGKKKTVENYSKDGNNLPRYWNTATLLCTTTDPSEKDTGTGTATATVTVTTTTTTTSY